MDHHHHADRRSDTATIALVIVALGVILVSILGGLLWLPCASVQLLFHSVLYRLEPHPSVDAVDCPAAGINGGILGQGDDVQHGRANMPIPGLRKRNLRWFSA